MRPASARASVPAAACDATPQPLPEIPKPPQNCPDVTLSTALSSRTAPQVLPRGNTGAKTMLSRGLRESSWGRSIKHGCKGRSMTTQAVAAAHPVLPQPRLSDLRRQPLSVTLDGALRTHRMPFPSPPAMGQREDDCPPGRPPPSDASPAVHPASQQCCQPHLLRAESEARSCLDSLQSGSFPYHPHRYHSLTLTDGNDHGAVLSDSQDLSPTRSGAATDGEVAGIPGKGEGGAVSGVALGEPSATPIEALSAPPSQSCVPVAAVPRSSAGGDDVASTAAPMLEGVKRPLVVTAVPPAPTAAVEAEKQSRPTAPAARPSSDFVEGVPPPPLPMSSPISGSVWKSNGNTAASPLVALMCSESFANAAIPALGVDAARSGDKHEMPLLPGRGANLSWRRPSASTAGTSVPLITLFGLDDYDDYDGSEVDDDEGAGTDTSSTSFSPSDTDTEADGSITRDVSTNAASPLPLAGEAKVSTDSISAEQTALPSQGHTPTTWMHAGLSTSGDGSAATAMADVRATPQPLPTALLRGGVSARTGRGCVTTVPSSLHPMLRGRETTRVANAIAAESAEGAARELLSLASTSARAGGDATRTDPSKKKARRTRKDNPKPRTKRRTRPHVKDEAFEEEGSWLASYARKYYQREAQFASAGELGPRTQGYGGAGAKMLALFGGGGGGDNAEVSSSALPLPGASTRHVAPAQLAQRGRLPAPLLPAFGSFASTAIAAHQASLSALRPPLMAVVAGGASGHGERPEGFADSQLTPRRSGCAPAVTRTAPYTSLWGSCHSACRQPALCDGNASGELGGELCSSPAAAGAAAATTLSAGIAAASASPRSVARSLRRSYSTQKSQGDGDGAVAAPTAVAAVAVGAVASTSLSSMQHVVLLSSLAGTSEAPPPCSGDTASGQRGSWSRCGSRRASQHVSSPDVKCFEHVAQLRSDFSFSCSQAACADGGDSWLASQY